MIVFPLKTWVCADTFEFHGLSLRRDSGVSSRAFHRDRYRCRGPEFEYRRCDPKAIDSNSMWVKIAKL